MRYRCADDCCAGRLPRREVLTGRHAQKAGDAHNACCRDEIAERARGDGISARGGQIISRIVERSGE